MCLEICVSLCAYKETKSHLSEQIWPHDTFRPGGWWWIEGQPARLHFLLSMWKEQVFSPIFFSLLFHSHRTNLGFPSKRLVHRGLCWGPPRQVGVFYMRFNGCWDAPVNHFMSNWLFSVNLQTVTCKDLYCLGYRFCQQPHYTCSQRQWKVHLVIHRTALKKRVHFMNWSVC